VTPPAFLICVSHANASLNAPKSSAWPLDRSPASPRPLACSGRFFLTASGGRAVFIACVCSGGRPARRRSGGRGRRAAGRPVRPVGRAQAASPAGEGEEGGAGGGQRSPLLCQPRHLVPSGHRAFRHCLARLYRQGERAERVDQTERQRDYSRRHRRCLQTKPCSEASLRTSSQHSVMCAASGNGTLGRLDRSCCALADASAVRGEASWVVRRCCAGVGQQ
jgi:hypothetical protein